MDTSDSTPGRSSNGPVAHSIALLPDIGVSESEEKHAIGSMRDTVSQSQQSTADSGTGSSESQKFRARTPPLPSGIPVAVQNQEHYQQLADQGKLRQGTIIKTTNRRGKGSMGSHVVLGMDGSQRRMPKHGSQSSLVPSEASVETSQASYQSQSNGVDASTSCGHQTPGEERKSAGYQVKERDGLGEFWVIIVNGAKLKLWEKKCARLLNQLSLVKWKVYVTKYPGHGSKLAYRAQNKGADMILAVGGDGTLQEVVDGMMKSHCKDEMGLPKAILTILPLGSANDFHRSMGWNVDFEDAMWRIGKRGQTALMDVGKVTCVGADGALHSTHWMNISSIGATAKAAGSAKKFKLFGRLKYTLAGLLEGWLHLNFRQKELAVSYDDGNLEHVKNVASFMACNGNTFGHGHMVSTSATPYDGALDVVLLQSPGSIFMLGRIMSKMAKGVPSTSKYLKSRKCTRFEIFDVDRKGNPIDVDFLHSVQNPGLSRAHSSASLKQEDSVMTVSQSEDTGVNGEVDEVTSELKPEHDMKSTVEKKDMRDITDENLKTLMKHTFPIECDGNVIGHLPARVEILPQAVKFRIHQSE
jgi:diacylglycerol kinase (ATP)